MHTRPLALYRQLQNASFDEAGAVTVENLTLKKDRGTFHFKSGTFYFVETVNDELTGAVFLGDLNFRFIPPNEIERYQLHRFIDADSLDENFTAAYFRFSDSTFAELVGGTLPDAAQMPKQVRKLRERVEGFLLQDRGMNLNSRLLGDLLNPSRPGFFFSVLRNDQENSNFPNYCLYVLDRLAQEQVGLFQYFPHRAPKAFYTLCSFDSEFAAPEETPALDRFAVEHYRLKIVLQKSGKVRNTAEMRIKSLVDGLRVLSFDLFVELEIDSVRSATGDSLAFIKEEKEPAVKLVLDSPMSAGENRRVTVFYSGELLANVDGNYAMKHRLNWYPRAGYLQPATYEISYAHPKNMQVLSTGVRVQEWETGEEKHSKWVQEVPSLAAAFGFGRFEESSFQVSDSMSVQVYSEKSRSKRVREQIGSDVVGSFHFFENLIGGYPYSHLRVVESPSQGSNGYPGTLFLTSLTFSVQLEGVMEELRGHELSHQWWGNLVGWQSYHDQWLSEAFAEYSGALMNQFLLDGDKRFFESVAGWRDDLLDKGHIGVSLGLRRFGFSKSDLAQSEGLRAGPIWLGARLGSRHPIDYYVNVYEKGAYVLHMLRVMLRDFETGSDARFLAMLRDFAQTYGGRRTQTADFERIVDRHFDRDMRWFFEQWVYGVDVPTYIYATAITEEPEGYFVELTVTQEDVEPDFLAFIPVGIELPDSRKMEVVSMTGRQRTFRLGPFPVRPERVRFNDYDGVLARVRQR